MFQPIPDLAIFDPEAIAKHAITEGDLRDVWRYVTILQGSVIQTLVGFRRGRLGDRRCGLWDEFSGFLSNHGDQGVGSRAACVELY